MTSSMDSMIFAVLRQSARIRYRSVKAAFLFAIMTIALGAHASVATNEAEARALFTKYVAAQIAPSVDDVKSMLWNSPGTLLLARGVEIRGPAAVADRFKEYYGGTWHVEPDMSQFHVTSISKDVMQFLVPVVFKRGLPGQPSQDNKFLVTQTLVHEANGWHIASIISIADTQPK
jgi:alkanesulfonate monooxygenase SsuD/methylene tetrahydromethanopterin reductase-like flavin-dependent oxidoreductase (luciferase family)